MSQTIRTVDTAYWSWLTVLRLTLDTAEGFPVTREVVERPDAAAVLPYDPERRTALLVRLPRAPALYAHGLQTLTEAPAGLVEEGEEAEACVRREALEEVGVTLRELDFVGRPFSSPGFSTERIALYLAPFTAADRTGAGGGVAHEHEDIAVLEVALADLDGRLARGEIEDMKTLALVQALKLRRPELFARP
jgi:nudix-type nucleoside diphosphatase (YffH/AdpP family)